MASVEHAMANATVNDTTLGIPHPTQSTLSLAYKLSTLQITFIILGAIFFIQCLQSLLNSKKSPLSAIPGPWYAPYTTLHLRYLFAQGTIWKYAEEQHRKYGSVIRLGPRQIWVSDKVALKDILLTTDLPKVSMYAEISRDRNSPGLFGEIRPIPHKNLKRFLSPAFTVSSVDKLDRFFMNCVSTLIRNYYEQKEKTHKLGIETDLMRDMHCLALDIMGESAFRKGFGQMEQVFDPSKIITERERKWSRIPDAIFSGLANRCRFVFIKRFLRCCGINVNFDWPKEMTRAISSLIDERRNDMATKGRESENRTDILQHMIDEGNRPDTGFPMCNRDIIDQMSELLLAGSETTSGLSIPMLFAPDVYYEIGTIGCFFLELCRNPEVKRKLLASLPILGRDDAILDSKTVRTDSHFRYLEACIKENLRMHPIASEMGRRTLEKSHVVAGHYIPPYTVVSASYRHLHLNENHWPNADKFWPERWLGEDGEGAPAPDLDAYYPFSAGKHACIGQNFAYAEIRTVSANILSRFDVEEVGKKSIQFRQFITMQFHDGSWNVKLTPRK